MRVPGAPALFATALGALTWGATGSTALAQDTYHSDLRSRFDREIEHPAPKPGLSIEPRIESALMLVGNINLAEDSEDEVDVAGIEASPGIYASYFSPRAQGALDYTFIGRAFEDDDYNDVSHRLAANGNYTLLPDWFFVRGQASYSDTIVDPALGYNYGGSGLFNETNLAEVATASVEPGMHHEFRHVAVDARYSYGRVWYLDDVDAPSSPLFAGYDDDAENQRLLVSASSVDPNAAASMRAYYEWQGSDFERSIPYRYERAGAELSLRIVESLRLVGDGGVESDLDEDTTDGGLDTTFWHVGSCPYHGDCVEGLASGSSLEARFGERLAELQPDHPIWEVVAGTLAQLCHVIVCAGAPMRIVIGGGVMEQQPHLLSRIQVRLVESLNGSILLPADEDYVRVPELGRDAGPLGAIALAMGVRP